MSAGVPRANLPYLNFEHERLFGLEAGQLAFVLDEYARRYPDAPLHGPVVWCFDEVQLVAGWEQFVRRVRHLLGNAGAPFSVEKFHQALKSQGVAISRDTVHQLLVHLDDCFLVRTVWMESSSERQRMVNPRKVYPVDPGLIPLFDRTGRANVGPALETAVLLELERRRLDVSYVRTPGGHEVDFLARDASGGATLIQVCADASDPATAAREIRALREAGAMHPGARKVLLTLTRDGGPAEDSPGITVQPVYEWMLEGGRSG